MRKIETVEEKERKEKKRQMILGIILILVLTMSIAGYATFSKTDDEIERRSYNGLDFTYDNGFWKTAVSEKNLAFYNLPYDLSEINISINKTISDFLDKPLYIVGYYPNTLSYNFGGIVLRMQNACLENKSCINSELPIKNCSGNNILVFSENNESRIYQEEDCIFLGGDLQKTSDKLIYNLLGIV